MAITLRALYYKMNAEMIKFNKGKLADSFLTGLTGRMANAARLLFITNIYCKKVVFGIGKKLSTWVFCF